MCVSVCVCISDCVCVVVCVSVSASVVVVDGKNGWLKSMAGRESCHLAYTMILPIFKELMPFACNIIIVIMHVCVCLCVLMCARMCVLFMCVA